MDPGHSQLLQQWEIDTAPPVVSQGNHLRITEMFLGYKWCSSTDVTSSSRLAVKHDAELHEELYVSRCAYSIGLVCRDYCPEEASL